jgi:hypothetical protein
MSFVLENSIMVARAMDQCRSPGHICAGTALTPATSATGLGSPLPTRTGTGAHPCHICAGTGAHPCPYLHRDWGSPLPTSAPGLGLTPATDRSALYLLESSYIATRMRIIFIVLVIFASVIEVAIDRRSARWGVVLCEYSGYYV